MTTARKTSLAVAITAAIASWSAGAQTLAITQSGEGNSLQVRQAGAIGATATVSQDATAAAISIDQFGSAHLARVVQAAGLEGSASIVQDSPDPAQATIEQAETVSSTADIRQLQGRGLDAAVVQTRTSLAVGVVHQSMSNDSRVGVLQVDSADVSARVRQLQSSAGVDILQQNSTSSVVDVDQTSSQAQVRIDQLNESESSATVMQSHTAGATDVTMRLTGNVRTAAAVTQRGVMGDSVRIEQTGNRETSAQVDQDGRSTGGPNRATVIQIGNQLTTARVSQLGGTHSAEIVQSNNVGVNGSIHQDGAWMPSAIIEQRDNFDAVESSARITQAGSTFEDARIVQRGNLSPTLRAGIVQSSAESGGGFWESGRFVEAYFEPGSHLGGGGNRFNTASIRQGYNSVGSVQAGVAMVGAGQSTSSVIQDFNMGSVLALHRMIGVGDTSGSITQEYNYGGVVSAEIAQVGGGANSVTLTQTGNQPSRTGWTGTEYATAWIGAEQLAAQAVTAIGLQTGSSSVVGLITQQEGSTDSMATLEQRNVHGAAASVLQGTNDMPGRVLDPAGAALSSSMGSLMNLDPGPGRGGAIASTAELLQAEGTDLAAGIVQTGSGLHAQIVQGGAWKEASLIQNGTGHVGSIAQGGVPMGAQVSIVPSVVDLRQYGAMPQTATITQHATGSSIAVVQQ